MVSLPRPKLKNKKFSIKTKKIENLTSETVSCHYRKFASHFKLVFRLIWSRTEKIRKGGRIPSVNQKLPARVSSNKGRSYRSPPTKNIYKKFQSNNFFNFLH
jgi:hypothetical protein